MSSVVIHTRQTPTEYFEDLYTLFRDTIHYVNKQDYDPDQLRVWAPQIPNRKRWMDMINTQTFFIATKDDMIVGFATLTDGGYLDLLYVHHNYQRQGIASRLYDQLETHANDKAIPHITTHASITAKPFFESKGFRTLGPNEITIDDVVLTNYSMHKRLLSKL